MIPVDPYVTDCATALRAAGHEVTETWTEPTEPVDHNIRVKVGEATLDLSWDERRQWVWIVYPRPGSTHSDAGPLFTSADHRADPADVVAGVERLIDRVVGSAQPRRQGAPANAVFTDTETAYGQTTSHGYAFRVF